MAASARTRFVAAGLAAMAVGCSPTAADEGSVAAGSWGGAHIRLTVMSDRADVEFDCARGTIDAPLTLDKSGQFDLRGTITPDGPGPTRENPPPPRPARYTGRLTGSTLTLAVTLTDTNDSVGTFTLRRGDSPGLTKCL